MRVDFSFSNATGIVANWWLHHHMWPEHILFVFVMRHDNLWFLRNLADANYGMLRGCAIFQHPRFLQTICLWSLPVLVLVLSVLTLFALMEHAKLEQIKLGSTIHTSFNERIPRFTCPSTGPVLQGSVNPASTASLSLCTPVTNV